MSSCEKPPSYSREAGTPSITPGHGLYTSDDQLRAVEALKTWVRE